VADYYPLIRRAVSRLPENTKAARDALYERARAALAAQLRTRNPVISASNAAQELRSLEGAIAKVEAEVGVERIGGSAPGGRMRPLWIAAAAMLGALFIAIGIWKGRTSGTISQPTIAVGKYRTLTKADGLSCAFSQDLTISLGSGFSGSASASANHFRCVDETGENREIELVSKDPNENVGIENGKVAIKLKNFGTVYRGNESGKFDVYEMTDSQISALRKFLGLRERSAAAASDLTGSGGEPTIYGFWQLSKTSKQGLFVEGSSNAEIIVFADGRVELDMINGVRILKSACEFGDHVIRIANSGQRFTYSIKNNQLFLSTSDKIFIYDHLMDADAIKMLKFDPRKS